MVGVGAASALQFFSREWRGERECNGEERQSAWPCLGRGCTARRRGGACRQVSESLWLNLAIRYVVLSMLGMLSSCMVVYMCIALPCVHTPVPVRLRLGEGGWNLGTESITWVGSMRMGTHCMGRLCWRQAVWQRVVHSGSIFMTVRLSSTHVSMAMPRVLNGSLCCILHRCCSAARLHELPSA